MTDLSNEQFDFIRDLLDKAIACNAKTESHKNCDLCIYGYNIPLRIDDHRLFYVGMRLLPNIVNYLVNIIPQFLYPYVVSYLIELSNDDDDPVTINNIYEILSEKFDKV